MKAQFKYAFSAGRSVRFIIFGGIVIMEALFALFTLTIAPWEALKITAVSLGGCAICAMLVANVIDDIHIARRMFSAPDAYLLALTPVPRWKTLLSSLITMLSLDILTMVVVVIGEVSLSFILADLWGDLSLSSLSITAEQVLRWVLSALLVVFGYLTAVLVVMFSVAAAKSVFHKKAAAGLLGFLLACGCFYLISLLPLILSPFGIVQWYKMSVILTLAVGKTGFALYVLLTALEAAGLFALTTRLMERKMNI